uniref:PQ-loop repeat-containing protein 1 n=1 Tax=Leptobrachium leishanense TaxID=445787 RepID=A0A8C5Q6Q4_9ANUR
MDPPDVAGESWSLLSLVSSVFIVFGGLLPYLPQYQQIKRTSNPDGFSTLVCLVLLVANILRIFFWFGKIFEFPLLLQSILMIVTMLVLLNLCCSLESENRVSTKQHHFTDFDLEYFWKWSRFEDYVQFCLSLAISAALMTYAFYDSPVFVEGIGLVSLLTEATLGLPQLLENFKNRSTQGMRVDGDICKKNPVPLSHDKECECGTCSNVGRSRLALCWKNGDTPCSQRGETSKQSSSRGSLCLYQTSPSRAGRSFALTYIPRR